MFAMDEIRCDVCGEILEPGDTYFEYESWICCCEECVKDKMYELYQNGVEEKYIKTAKDYEAEYYDDLGHAEREEM